jgi:hypothetical protein
MIRSVTRRPMFRYLVVLTIGSTVGLQAWRTLFNNFAADVVGLQGNHIGMIQSVREIPGFLALLAVYVLLVIREHRLSALSVLCLGLGVAATGFFPSYVGLLLTTLIFVLNNIINYFASPLIGRAIIRFGERRVLSLEYGGLIVVFLGYALTQSPWVAALLYIVDHLLFNFAIAIKTYFQKVADPRDTAPSMAVSFTINHIAAVLLPAMGGALWMIDDRIPFVAGAAMSLISLVAVQRIPSHAGPEGKAA